MRTSSSRRGACLLAASLLASASPCLAQGYATPPSTSGSAAEDPATELSRHLRELADNPRDLTALLGAGRAALAAGDANAAIGFFGRADEASPGNARVKAGLGAAMVQLEQPREALRLFAQAESAGLPAAEIAADRGLAYDLRGENKRAQAEYQVALAANPRNDEAARRYALSLAIAGDRAGALAALDPLMRRQDRAAWRASAFVLALTGDAPGAVARTGLLLPRPQVALIAPFFPRLAGLSSAQKASAVHFGRLPGDGRPPPETEFADSRFAGPPISAPSITVRTSVADHLPDGSPQSSSVAATLPDRSVPSPDLSGGVPRGTPLAPSFVRVAPLASPPLARPIVVASLPRAVASPSPLRPAPVPAASQPPAPIVQASAGRLLARTSAPPPAATAAVPEPTFVRVTPPRAPVGTPVPIRAATVAPTPPPFKAAPAPEAIATLTLPPPPIVITLPPPATAPETITAVTSAPPAIVIPAPVAPQLTLSARTGQSSAAAAPVSPIAMSAAPVPPPSRPSTVRPTELAMIESPSTGRADATPITPEPVPAHASRSAPITPEPVPPHAPRPAQIAPAPEPDLTAATSVDRVERSRSRHPARPAAGGTTNDLLAVTLPSDVAPAAKAASPLDKPSREQDAPAGPGKAKEKPDRSEAAKAKDKKKPEEDTEAASDRKSKARAKDEVAQKSVAKKEPERYWVQVATGANKADLPKAWRNVKAKYGAQLGGRAPWTTPLRFTNRVLVGPFKSSQEAQAFVNSASKAGMGASTFTSPAGQAIEKLPSE